MTIKIDFMCGDNVIFDKSTSVLEAFEFISKKRELPFRCIVLYINDDENPIDDANYQLKDTNIENYYALFKPQDSISNNYQVDKLIFDKELESKSLESKLSSKDYFISYYEDILYYLDDKLLTWLKTNIINFKASELFNYKNKIQSTCYQTISLECLEELIENKCATTLFNVINLSKLRKNLKTTSLTQSYITFIERDFYEFMTNSLEFKYESHNRIEWIKHKILDDIGFNVSTN